VRERRMVKVFDGSLKVLTTDLGWRRKK